MIPNKALLQELAAAKKQIEELKKAAHREAQEFDKQRGLLVDVAQRAAI